jgi:hypothetical protein
VAAILEAGREMLKRAPVGAYLDVVLRANAGVVMEIARRGDGMPALDDVLTELGFTARWEARGREEGIEKGREEVARNALARGLPLETIGEITGFDVETIKHFSAP